ncbi:24267_t:CDS:2, partial [Racocetra persica]
LAVKEAEINQLTQEIAAKNETITSLRKRIEDLTSRKVKKDQKEQAAIIISLGKQIEVQKEQITEAENHRERAAREKQALAEEVENLRQQSEELIKLVEKDFQTFSEQLTGLQAISRKYEEMLACLGGEIPTLFDIKKISGIGSLQDLIDEVEKLRSEVSELTESQEPTGERSLADELSTASQLTEESIKAKLSTGFLKATEEIVELTGAEIATAKKKTEDLEKDLKEFADRTGYSLEALKYLSFTENYSLRQLIDSHAAGWQLIETQMDPTGKLFPEFGESRRKKIYEKAAEKLKKFPQLEEAFVKMEKIFRDFIEQVIEKADIELNEQTYDRNENQTNLDTHQRVCDAILGKLEAKLREKSGSQENGEKQLEKLKENNADLQKTNQLLKWTTGIGALVSLNTPFALTYIYGIGRSRAKEIVAKLKISPQKKAGSLTDEEVKLINEEIKHFPVEGELRRINQEIVNEDARLGSYRGLRRFKLPVNGQRTRHNARTCKGPVRKTIANKKKAPRPK